MDLPLDWALLEEKKKVGLGDSNMRRHRLQYVLSLQGVSGDACRSAAITSGCWRPNAGVATGVLGGCSLVGARPVPVAV